MAEPTTTTTTEPDPINKLTPIPTPSLQKTTSSSVSSWGTLEELLLACAVNRHGTNSWDSVAKELNHRQSSLLTPHTCRLKYLDIKRHFAGKEGGADDGAAVWLEELRRRRVAELKRDLHRYDLSIVSLQLKVKRLKEERERSLKEVDEKSKEEIFEDRENSDLKKNESSNVSISTDPTPEPPVEAIKTEPDSCNGSSNWKESGACEMDVGDRVESGELGESAAESRRGEEGEGVKENSDVQSTASLRRNSSGDDNQSLGSKFSGGGSGGGGGDKEESAKRKSQGGLVLVHFLDMVRARKCGSVFDRRLESQETPKYKSLIKEHIDLEIIRKRMEEGLYTDCHPMFYRDLMLLVNNAIVFFSKRSSEHKFATELRQLVTHHFQTHLKLKNCRASGITPPAGPPKPTKPEVDQAHRIDLKPKLAMSGPVITCRKRSSITGKLSSSEAEEKEIKKASSSTSVDALTKKQTRDPSFRPRNPTSKNHRSSRPSPSQNQKTSPRTISSKGEISEAKKPSIGNSSSKSKQGSRPGNDLLLDVLDSAVKRKIFGNGSGSVRSDRHKDQGEGSHNGVNKKPGLDKGKGKEERESPRNKNTGRPPKKEAVMPMAGKRGRDGGRELDAHTKKRQRR